MKKLFILSILLLSLVCFSSCQENQRRKYSDKISGDISGKHLKGYASYYDVGYDSYSISDDTYPIYKDGSKYYIEIDGEYERLYKLDDPLRIDDYTKLRYKTNSDLYIESIPSSY